MKRLRWTVGTAFSFIILLIVVFNTTTRPLISSNEALATAREQLRLMGYKQSYGTSSAVTSLAWYNHGKLLGFERVYNTNIGFMPVPGEWVNVEVVEDARTGAVVAAFRLGNHGVITKQT